MSLQNLTIRDAEHVTDPVTGRHVYHVKDPHALVQAAGYLKHVRGRRNDEAVFFRGETRVYSTLSPSLFRGLLSRKRQELRMGQLRKAIADTAARNRVFSKMDVMVHEPLLQHYGIRTSWIDVVDNVWVALWFACHKALTTGTVNQYLHFEQRTAAKDPGGYAYVLLIATDAIAQMNSPKGMIIGKASELVDLRIAAPSYFLRPHAQHGLLMRMRGQSGGRPLDYAAQIRGIIRINLGDALEWLGQGKMLGVHALFPPPFYDKGYGVLLQSGFPESMVLGAISHVGT